MLCADGEEVIPEKVAALILGAIMEKAAPIIQSKGGEAERALVTVPAYFSNIQLNAMKAALRMVSTTGLATYQEGFAREPSAAAFDFMHEVHNPSEIKHLLMFDFGGGTLDVSVIFQETPDKLEVKGQAGDLFLGGEDLDDKMVELVRSFTISLI